MRPEDVKQAHEFAYGLGERHEAHIFVILNKDGTMAINHSGDRQQKALMALSLTKVLSELVVPTSQIKIEDTPNKPTGGA